MLALKKQLSKIHLWIFPFLLVLLTCIVCILNYQPDTWLTGWDTLHPEFDFSLNFKRIITGVWRQEQGLGAVAGHSHMADLPRVIIIYLVSFVLPLSFLRWFYIFLCLILGPLGVYFFLERIVFRKKVFYAKIASFLGALFYLFNLSTLQHFVVPFEMFITQFAFLGWLFLFASKFLQSKKKKDLILFSLATFFSTPMAYASALWYVYFLGLLMYLASLSLFSARKKDLQKLKTSIVLLVVTLFINSFWLLPNIYFIVRQSSKVSQAKINQLFSETAFLRNKEFGTIKDTAIFKNFLFKWNFYNFDQFNVGYLLKPWLIHFDKPSVLIIGYSLFGVVLLGIMLSFIKKEKNTLAILPIFLIFFAFLASDIPIVEPIITFLRNNLSVFQEGLRFPFTKFSLLLQFSYAVFFSSACFFIIEYLAKRFKKIRVIIFLFPLVFVCLFSYYLQPSFSGQLISPIIKVKIPNKYFDLFSWFKDKSEHKRIAVLPVHSFWGWEYYDWSRTEKKQGFQGAGFLYFGIKQPILVRDFDRWEPANENFYWQINQAIYSQNLDHLESILEKYQINFLVLDKNIRGTGDHKALYFPETENLFDQSPKISLDKSFEDIKVYKVNLQIPIKDFVFLTSDLPEINQYNWNNEDTAFQDYGHYQGITINNASQRRANILLNQQPIIFYPFRSLFTGRKQEELEFGVEDKGDHFLFSNNIPFKLLNLKLFKPLLSEFESKHWTKNLQEQPIATPSVQFIPSLALRQLTDQGETGKVEVKIEKKKGYFSYDSQDDNNFFNLEPKSCNPFNTGEMKREIIEEKNQQLLRFTSIGSSNCLSVNLSHFIQKTGYLVKVQHQHVDGKQMLFKIINETSKNTIIETNLPKSLKTSYFIIPPQEQYGQGYSFHFDNISIGRQKTINNLGRIEVYPIPYCFLKQLKFQSVTMNNMSESELVTTNNFSVNHPNPSFYKITIDKKRLEHLQQAIPQMRESDTSTKTIVLSQSFHPGWAAFYKDGKKWKRLEDHVLVNNWQNGWKINSNNLKLLNSNNLTIYILFLPQLLEYLGFALLVLFSFFILHNPRSRAM